MVKDKLQMNEELEALKVVKAGNSLGEDLKLIEKGITHHFFMRSLDRRAR